MVHAVQFSARRTREPESAMMVPKRRLLLITLVLVTTCLGCWPRNPTPGAEPVAFKKVWVRHQKDRYDREADIVVGFTLVDNKNKPVAADGKLDVELEWDAAMHTWTATGKVDVRANSFRAAENKPVADGSWYVEPWSINTIGPQYPGPSRGGYTARVSFVTAGGRKLTWSRWVNPIR